MVAMQLVMWHCPRCGRAFLVPDVAIGNIEIKLTVLERLGIDTGHAFVIRGDEPWTIMESDPHVRLTNLRVKEYRALMTKRLNSFAES